MSKELPYFKFEPNAWDSGNIQICSMEAQGLFINICSLYWSRLGDLPIKLAMQKICKPYANAFQELCDEDVIALVDDKVRIDFLDEQLGEFESISDKRRKAANDRWAKKRQEDGKNANDMQMHSKSNANVMLLREEEKREEKKKGDKSNKKIFPFRQSLINLGCDECHISDWLKVRAKKKASNTQTAFNGFINEVSKAGITPAEAVKICAERSWQGFKADWYKPEDLKNNSSMFTGLSFE